MKTQTKSSAQNIVKCLLITSVVFFHALMFVANDSADVLSNFNALLVMFPFLMMVFFFYAGYNYTPGKRSFGQNIKRRTLQLLIPLVITFVVSTLLIFAIRLPSASNTADELEKLKNGILMSLMSEPLSIMVNFHEGIVPISFDIKLALGILWFLYALYICSIFFFLLVDFAIKKLSRIISIIIALLLVAFVLGEFVGIYLPYTVQCYPVALAMMLLAAYLKQFNFLDKKPETKKGWIIHISNVLVAEGIIIGIGLFCYYYWGLTLVGSLPGGRFDPYLKGFDAFFAFAIGFLGTYVIHQVSRLITLAPVVSNVLDWYGRHSAYVYLAHPICLSFIHTVIFKEQKTVVGGFQPYLYVFITIAILVVIFILVDYLIAVIRNKKHQAEAQ